jgi:predicted lipid-binding transport protein (Tim44 family)
MAFLSRSRKMLALLAVGVAFSFVSVDYADARRGGGFGSRGVRTFQSAPPTNTAPRQTAPIERSMTPRTQAPAQAARPNAAQRQGLFGGFGGTMMRGLLLGGLLGLLLGYGFGGLAGLFGLLLQVGLVVLAVVLVMRFMRSRQQPAYAGAGAPVNRDTFEGYAGGPRVDIPPAGAGAAGAATAAGSASHGPQDEIGITQNDLDTFERLLREIQEAFSAEDFAALRARTTPEVMSFFAEELSQNATRGLRNEVRDVRLLQGDLAEAWREGETEYATVAMRYESKDAMRERETGQVAQGDPERPTETTEVWTFMRTQGADWKLSAIQDV